MMDPILASNANRNHLQVLNSTHEFTFLCDNQPIIWNDFIFTSWAGYSYYNNSNPFVSTVPNYKLQNIHTEMINRTNERTKVKVLYWNVSVLLVHEFDEFAAVTFVLHSKSVKVVLVGCHMNENAYGIIYRETQKLHLGCNLSELIYGFFFVIWIQNNK